MKKETAAVQLSREFQGHWLCGEGRFRHVSYNRASHVAEPSPVMSNGRLLVRRRSVPTKSKSDRSIRAIANRGTDVGPQECVSKKKEACRKLYEEIARYSTTTICLCHQQPQNSYRNKEALCCNTLILCTPAGTSNMTVHGT